MGNKSYLVQKLTINKVIMKKQLDNLPQASLDSDKQHSLQSMYFQDNNQALLPQLKKPKHTQSKILSLLILISILTVSLAGSAVLQSLLCKYTSTMFDIKFGDWFQVSYRTEAHKSETSTNK